MNIAGKSFAALTQLTQDSQNRAATGADDRIAKRAALRAERIETARAAQQQDVQKFQSKTFQDELGTKPGKRGAQRPDTPSTREALGQRPQPRAQPGQVVNILI